MRRGCLPGIMVILLTSACSKSGPTVVGGEVALRLDPQTAATITVPEGTTLPDSATATANGQLVGHCVLGESATDVELERTANGDASVTGFAWFRMHLDSPDAPHVARVLADYDGELFEADCDVDAFARSRDDGVLDVSIESCELLAPTPSGNATTTIDVDLAFDGCRDH